MIIRFEIIINDKCVHPPKIQPSLLCVFTTRSSSAPIWSGEMSRRRRRRRRDVVAQPGSNSRNQVQVESTVILFPLSYFETGCFQARVKLGCAALPRSLRATSPWCRGASSEEDQVQVERALYALSGSRVESMSLSS